MLYPSIDSLSEIGSKYHLVNIAATRARRLQEGAKRISKVKTNKNVTVALNEIFDRQIHFFHTRDTKRSER